MENFLADFEMAKPLIAMTEQEQLEAVALLRDAVARIGLQPVTVGELLDTNELRLRIVGFLRTSGSQPSAIN